MRNLQLMICFVIYSTATCQHQSNGSQRKRSALENRRISYTNMRMKLGVPSYAVQMEPLVQYSQPDPLYSIEKQFLTEQKSLDSSNNNVVRNTYPGQVVGDIMEVETISRVGQITHARLRPPTHLHPPRMPRPARGRPAPAFMSQLRPPSHDSYWDPPEPEIPEPPEPIIEIIIRESNESLPAPPPIPTPPPPKKVKEPVQVFYVKYSKDPSGGYGGEEKVIYDPPVPAVTPPENNEDLEEEAPEPEPVIEPEPEEATAPPPPSTTLKAIVRPDSETFESQSGVRITFGQGDEHGSSDDGASGPGPSGDAGETGPGPYGRASDVLYGHESAPQPAVVMPNHSPKTFISRSSTGQVSTITKRNPAPFNGQQPFPPNNFQPNSGSFQQLPLFPAQDFQPPSINPGQYSTLPQNFQQPQQIQNIPQQPLRYTTINNPPPIAPVQQPQQQYHTINNNVGPTQAPHFQNFQQQQQQQNTQKPHHPQPSPPPRINSQEQHQQHVEQVNRLQHQQQQLQQQLAQQHRFQSPQFPQQNQPLSLTTQYSQQPSQQVFTQHSQQPSAPLQQQHLRPEQVQQFQSQRLQPHQHHQSLPQHQHHQSLQQQQQHHNQPVQQQRPQFHQQPQFHLNSQHPNHAEQNQLRNHRPETHSTHVPTPRPLTPTPSPAQNYYRTTSPATTTEEVTEIVTEDPEAIAKAKKQKDEKQKKNIANLPDEVPDDLRQQLLSSGILSNADIEILDYDKIGDIPIESLPPEALANFQQASAGSERVEIRRRPKESAEDRGDSDSESSASEQRQVTVNTEDGEMEMKVVRFNPEEGGVAERYMKKDATRVAPVVLNDNKYNRYLPLQVSGAQFPVPDIPELRGRNVSSVVVLAPVNYEFLNRREEGDTRTGRSASPVLEVQGVHFIAGDVLRTLVHMPTAENYRRWLDKENTTSVDKQSVVLLVVGPGQNHPEKEIFMYDISSSRVSKLRGELSATFVQVAESNSNNKDLEEISDAKQTLLSR